MLLLRFVKPQLFSVYVLFRKWFSQSLDFLLVFHSLMKTRCATYAFSDSPILIADLRLPSELSFTPPTDLPGYRRVIGPLSRRKYEIPEIRAGVAVGNVFQFF